MPNQVFRLRGTNHSQISLGSNSQNYLRRNSRAKIIQMMMTRPKKQNNTLLTISSTYISRCLLFYIYKPICIFEQLILSLMAKL
ncbi:hypothetical protein K450DRAFT_244618 [Umbelopsis ramanniana AG]|uniref:Uncharacterized protein n=1 Tax=Umbelopsis ramanniana AG TaxID=1314678 RepID=A0AAD5E8U9_UMBRA|nr:uncharacterized protein K450DRAFT_244618 [Umbelopsis ramanniana AG]KAI8579024.1 hypothetical protein K450DRAFT_244618 [Umbelopsis ramanniana AG]